MVMSVSGWLGSAWRKSVTHDKVIKKIKHLLEYDTPLGTDHIASQGFLRWHCLAWALAEWWILHLPIRHLTPWRPRSPAGHLWGPLQPTHRVSEPGSRGEGPNPAATYSLVEVTNLAGSPSSRLSNGNNCTWLTPGSAARLGETGT